MPSFVYHVKNMHLNFLIWRIQVQTSRTRLRALDDLLTSRGVDTAHLTARVSNGAGLSPTPTRPGSQARNLGAVPAPGAAAANGGRSTTPPPRFQIDTPHFPSAMENLEQRLRAAELRLAASEVQSVHGSNLSSIVEKLVEGQRELLQEMQSKIQTSSKRVAVYHSHSASCCLA